MIDIEQFKTELTSYFRSLAGVKAVGDYWFGIDPKSKPYGVQLYAGQVLSRSSYETHWNFVSGGHRTIVSEAEWQTYVTTYGHCPWFSYGDGSTTYRMPLIKDVHPEFVSALIKAGQYIEAGLPNITAGNIGRDNDDWPPTGAAFAGTTTSYVGYSSGSNGSIRNFDASLSNHIYGNSDTVQPPSINMLIGEYVFSTIAPIGVATEEVIQESIRQLEEQIANTVRSVNGVTADVDGNVAINFMPDYSAGVTHTASQTEAEFTAPSNGVVTVDFAGFNDVYCYLKINGQIMFNKTSNGSNFIIGATGEYQVNKGDVVTYKNGYNSSSFAATASLVFYPIKGV